MTITKSENIYLLGAFVVLLLTTPMIVSKFKAFTYQTRVVAVPQETSDVQLVNSSFYVSDTPSPDGKAGLNMKLESKDNLKTYEVTTQSGFKFEKKLTEPDKITIPFNTWSPGNKYLFLEETLGNSKNYYVFAANGAKIRNMEYVDLTSEFGKKLSQDFELTDVTGWAGSSLLIVNTNKKDGSLGPSFWFDITNSGFIRLSQRFN